MKKRRKLVILVIILLVAIIASILIKVNIETNNSLIHRLAKIVGVVNGDTTINCEVLEQESEYALVMITLENPNGFDKIQTDGNIINSTKKTKVSFDKKIDNTSTLHIKVTGYGESEKDYTLIVGPKLFVENYYQEDESGNIDDTIKTIRIGPIDENLKLYFYANNNSSNWINSNTNTIQVNEVDNIMINDTKCESTIGEVIDLRYHVDPMVVSAGIIKAASSNYIENDKYYNFVSGNEIYNVHAYVEDGNLTIGDTNPDLGDTYSYGDEKDVATADEYAKSTVLLKVKGNLTVNENSTLTTCRTDYGGPKGFFIYCDNTITNKGTISMTARGAKAEGQDVNLYKDIDTNEYDFVPKVGASGGSRYSIYGDWYSSKASNGYKGQNGSNRRTGGGGSASGRSSGIKIWIDAGGSGTSYSGGSGSGAAYYHHGYSTTTPPSSFGGKGGTAFARDETGWGVLSFGGTGNPSGGYAAANCGVSNYVYRSGTGGLMIIYSNNFSNNNIIEAMGVSSSTGNRTKNWGGTLTGGASGGGSINIIYKNSMDNTGTITADGGAALSCGGPVGGAGGDGCVTTTMINYL